MSVAVKLEDVQAANIEVKRRVRTIKSYVGLMKSKVSGIEATLNALAEKADDILQEPPSYTSLQTLRDMSNKLDLEVRVAKGNVKLLEQLSDELDAIIG
jgi:bifunctional pyridoxal-dependent enzyme with beta-cystathionase and maltose regulon repressor activities